LKHDVGSYFFPVIATARHMLRKESAQVRMIKQTLADYILLVKKRFYDFFYSFMAQPL
jgi:hypothetical protein